MRVDSEIPKKTQNSPNLAIRMAFANQTFLNGDSSLTKQFSEQRAKQKHKLAPNNILGKN